MSDANEQSPTEDDRSQPGPGTTSEPQEHAPAWRSSPPALLGVLAMIGVLIIVALIFYFLNAAAEGEDSTRVPANVETMVPGVWRSTDGENQLEITFGHDDYQVTTFQGYNTFGTWSVNAEDLVVVPIEWRDYEGVWLFEPVTANEMHLEVEELGWDRTFQKVH
jgi:hypothetical protein